MTTPAPVDWDQAARAMDRIASRHGQAKDPHLHKLTAEPHQVLGYLRRYSERMPEEVRRQDVKDGLILRVWMWWEGQRDEAWLLEQASRLEMPNREAGKILNITSRQGVRDRRDRLDALKATGRPDEKWARASRSLKDPELRWRYEHTAEVLDASAIVLEYRDLLVALDASEDECDAEFWISLLADPVEPPGPDRPPTHAYVVAWSNALTAVGKLPFRDVVTLKESAEIQRGVSLAAEFRTRYRDTED